MSETDRIYELERQLEDANRKVSDTISLNSRLTDLIDHDRAKARTGHNQNFIQLYKNQARELRRLGDKNKVALNLLLLFGEKMNKQNALMISYTALAKITGKTRQTLSKAVKVLTDEKFVKVIKVGSANAYVVNSDVFWTSNAKAKEKMSVFSATVIATESEQENGYVENWDKVQLKSLPLIEQNELAFEHDAE